MASTKKKVSSAKSKVAGSSISKKKPVVKDQAYNDKKADQTATSRAIRRLKKTDEYQALTSEEKKKKAVKAEKKKELKRIRAKRAARREAEEAAAKKVAEDVEMGEEEEMGMPGLVGGPLGWWEEESMDFFELLDRVAARAAPGINDRHQAYKSLEFYIQRELRAMEGQ